MSRTSRAAPRTEATSSVASARQQARADFTSYINSTVLEAVQKSIQSASAHQAQRKKLLNFLIPQLGTNADGVTQYAGFDGEEIKDATITALRDVVLNRLPIPTSNDSLKRFTQFLFELCKTYGRETKAASGEYLDDVPATIIESLVSYHNAKDKQVRLMVCTLIQALLVTLTETVPREALYAALTNGLKDRCFDKCPLVREKAISALKAFHLGEKEDDVTQVAIALMCEDSSPKVREAAILSVARFRSVHLRHVIRMTRDVHSSVRRACWESLACYSVKEQLLGYCMQLGIDLFDVAASGLKDPSEPVRDACRNTLSVAWLQRGFASDLQSMVDAFFRVPTVISMPSATAVIRYLLTTLKQQWKPISLVLNPLTPAAAMVWKCSVMHFLDTNDEGDRDQHNPTSPTGGVGNPRLSPDDDACGLPMLPKFRIILTSVVNQYAGKAPAASSDVRASGLVTSIQPEDIKVPPSNDNKDITFVIDLLLSVFEIYADLGMLGHADDNGRTQMMRPLGFLLKVVTIEKPICFVDASVRAIKSISERHEGEGRQLIESALRMLFSLLSIPKRHQLSYEDIEAYSRADFERRRRIAVLESQRLRDGEELVEGSEEEELLDDISTDDAVMLRMSRIVHAYLSCVLRGTDIPAFVSHIIQLGRAQHHVETRALSMQCLALQCLINPQTVTTFLPIFMSLSSDASSIEVAVAAASGLFDMMSEYGPKFFDAATGGPPPPPPQQQGEAGESNPPTQTPLGHPYPQRSGKMDAEQQRVEIERLAAEDDSYKPGSQVIVKQMMAFLQSESAEMRHLAMFGFCKLLASNRLIQEATVPVIARLLHFYVTFEAASVDNKEQLQMHRLIEDFFRSFSFSHPRRQVQVLEGGLLALRLILNEHTARNGAASPDLPKVALKVLKRTVNLTDAINVQQVRDVDPDLSAQVAHQSAVEASRISGVNNDAALEDSVLSRSAANAATTPGGSKSNRSVTIRLWRELGRCSLHERLALELLADAAQFRDNDAIIRLLLQELPLLRLYKRDAMLYDCVKQHGEDCKAAIRSGPSAQGDELCEMIDRFVQGAEKIKAVSLDDTMFSGDMARGSLISTGAGNGFAFTPMSPTTMAAAAAASGGPDGSPSSGSAAAVPNMVEAAYGGNLAYRSQHRKALADAVNKFLVPVRNLFPASASARGKSRSASYSAAAAAAAIGISQPEQVSYGWIPRSDAAVAAETKSSSRAAGSKSASRAGGAASASQPAARQQPPPVVNQEVADIVRGVVTKKRPPTTNVKKEK